MLTWVNAKEVGLKGDGVTDDTQALKEAIEKYETIYFPQGEYIFSDTIKLKENTSLIGMNVFLYNALIIFISNLSATALIFNNIFHCLKLTIFNINLC